MIVQPKVLVVEDDDAIRTLLVAALRHENFVVDAASDGSQALELCAACEYAVIILDLMMPVVNGFDFLDAFEAATPSARSSVFVVTAFDDRVVSNLTSPRVRAVLTKPFDIEQLVAQAREVAAAWRDAAQPGAAAVASCDVQAEDVPGRTSSAC